GRLLRWTGSVGRRQRTLFPLDGAGRFRRNVQHHSGNTIYLVGNAGRNSLQNVIGKLGPVGCHRVIAGYRPEHHGMSVSTTITLSSERPDIGEQDPSGLPD